MAVTFRRNSVQNAFGRAMLALGFAAATGCGNSTAPSLVLNSASTGGSCLPSAELDDEGIAKVMARIAKDPSAKGYTVLALEWTSADDAAVNIADITMEPVDGASALKKLKDIDVKGLNAASQALVEKGSDAGTLAIAKGCYKTQYVMYALLKGANAEFKLRGTVSTSSADNSLKVTAKFGGAADTPSVTTITKQSDFKIIAHARLAADDPAAGGTGAATAAATGAATAAGTAGGTGAGSATGATGGGTASGGTAAGGATAGSATGSATGGTTGNGGGGGGNTTTATGGTTT